MNINSMRIFNSGGVFITQQLNRDCSYFVLHKFAHPQNHSPPKLLGFPEANGVLVVASPSRKINDLFYLPIPHLICNLVLYYSHFEQGLRLWLCLYLLFLLL